MKHLAPSPSLPAPETDQNIRSQIKQMVLTIPVGRVVAYGVLGNCCEPPLSGYFCGRLLGQMGQEIPWWRVLGQDGKMPISKRNPYLGIKQKALLTQEGVRFDPQGQVLPATFLTQEEAQHYLVGPEAAATAS